MKILGINNTITFERRPTKDEEPKIREACLKAYEAMGTTDRVVITHGSCFPALDRNTYIGSPYGKAAKEYIKFLQLYGFNGNQLGPGGELEMNGDFVNTSPYNSSAFAKNKLFIDLSELTTEKYGKILSQETYNNITALPEITDKNYDMTDFNQALKTYNTALKESYNNFKVNLAKHQPETIALNKEFQDFLDKHNERLTDEGIFKVLANYYQTDYFKNWDNELDKNLIPGVKNGDINSIKRYNSIKKANKNSIEQYKFEQFIATKQIKENKEWRDKIHFKYINDLLIGCSNMDEWRFKDAFLNDYSIGSYEYSGEHQVWKIPALNPQKMFKGADMKLNTGGQFLKDKIDSNLEFCENTRIDHALGLVEPYIIKNDSIMYDENGNLKYDKLQGSYMSQTYKDGQKIDDYYNYPRILEKIVLPALKEKGLATDYIIWETLCSNPELFIKIYYQTLNLPGLTQLEWSKKQNSPERNWHLVGSHDSQPAQLMVKDNNIRNYDNGAWNPFYLAGYLNQDPIRLEENKKLCEKLSSHEKTGEALDKANKELVKAKFAELLTSKKFEISFADLFGITDIIYNTSRQDNPDSWKERISPDYLDKYYSNLSSESPTALNMPEILKMALQAKIDMKVVNSQNQEVTRQQLYTKYQPLLDELQKYSDILKEPEPEKV